jgi:hypothetical protein
MREAVTDEDLVKVFAALVEKAIAGDNRHISLLLAYLAGKPVERQEIGGAGAFAELVAELQGAGDDGADQRQVTGSRPSTEADESGVNVSAVGDREAD